MDKQLYRQKSIERISSPEQLHDYMRVTSPRLWMILVAIIIMLAGLILLAATTQMENTLKTSLVMERTTGQSPDDPSKEEIVEGAYIELPIEQKDSLALGQEVRASGAKGTISMIYQYAESVVALVDMEEGSELPEGTHDAEVVIEKTTPMSYLLN